MDINEVRIKKRKLDAEIESLITSFSYATDCSVNNVSVSLTLLTGVEPNNFDEVIGYDYSVKTGIDL